MADEAEPAGAQPPAICPMCRRPAEPRYRPFCSSHCRDQDLVNWLDGRYAVPAIEVDDDDRDADQGA